MNQINPIIGMDYPDPDVIRVGEKYYMVSTTMHFMPGCEILESTDLIHWKHTSYVYDTQEGADNMDVYGKGMWAASLRYYKRKFYICFVVKQLNETVIYTSDKIDGVWTKKAIPVIYHDPSLLFEGDKVYISYGNRDIYITELEPDFSGPKKDGFHKKVISDADNKMLGYEGSHFYKINGVYYIFLIHSRKDRWKRVQACFAAKSLEDEFVGQDVFEENIGFNDSGVAQGGIVDTLDGDWYSILFQDRGAVGRIPVLVPIRWRDDQLLPEYLQPEEVSLSYEELVSGDDFSIDDFIKPMWQFNHNPDMCAIKIKDSFLTLKTTILSENVTRAKNTLTVRTHIPSCFAEITLDAGGLKDGDCAGLCILQGNYGLVGLTKIDGKLFITGEFKNDKETVNTELIPYDCEKIVFHVEAFFSEKEDIAYFYYVDDKKLIPVGEGHQLHFKLDHFTGARFGIFNYSTIVTGGEARFSHFVYI